MNKYEVKFDTYENGVKSVKRQYATKYFGGEVLAGNKELANLTVREWLCDEMQAHRVKIFKSEIFVDGVLRFGNFKAELLVA